MIFGDSTPPQFRDKRLHGQGVLSGAMQSHCTRRSEICAYSYCSGLVWLVCIVLAVHRSAVCETRHATALSRSRAVAMCCYHTKPSELAKIPAAFIVAVLMPRDMMLGEWLVFTVCSNNVLSGTC